MRSAPQMHCEQQIGHIYAERLTKLPLRRRTQR